MAEASAEKVDEEVEGGDEEGKGGDDKDSIDHICKEFIKRKLFYSLLLLAYADLIFLACRFRNQLHVVSRFNKVAILIVKRCDEPPTAASVRTRGAGRRIDRERGRAVYRPKHF